MPRLGPIRRRELVAARRELGFDGAEPGGSYEDMDRNGRCVRVPNAHEGDISHNLLSRILREAGVSRDEWDAL